ncbi:MAG TPA: DUF3048 domain-containing protein [Anaerovoracaceae bacterium]|nr:DUF3048 domain-containing protein [Anaerovoracaceae bacterium]
MKKVLIILLTLTVTLLISTSCGNNEAEEDPEEAVDIHAGMAISPLTGQWVDESIAEQRPVAIMINNIIDAQPMSGVSQADIIIEAPVEYNISRLLAIFQDYEDLDKIGSIRSCRLHYAILANEYNSIYIHFGASNIGYNFLYKGLLDHLDGMADDKVFYRSDDRIAPHNAYTSTEGIKAGIEYKEYNVNLESNAVFPVVFNDDEENEITLENGEEALKVSTNFSHNDPYFEYNDETKTYDRYQFDEAHVDIENGEQLTFKNLIVQECDWYMADSQHKHIITTGEGIGRYYTNGKMVNITWSKDSEMGTTHYYYEDGEELVLNKGKTFITLEIQNW